MASVVRSYRNILLPVILFGGLFLSLKLSILLDPNASCTNDTATMSPEISESFRNSVTHQEENNNDTYLTPMDYKLPSSLLKTWKSRPNPPVERNHSKMNVLFLVVDDFRPLLNAYSSLFSSPDFKTITPNMDALASRSLVLSKAYAQYSLCAPSRSSYMTGRNPDTVKVWDLTTYWRESGGNFTSMPEYFKNNGYYSSGFGKIYHPCPGKCSFDPYSWSDMFGFADHSVAWGPRHHPVTWKVVNGTTREQAPLPDEEITVGALKKLRMLANEFPDRPFFLAVGFEKPHLPLIFPEEFAHVYSEDELPHAKYPYVPFGYPEEDALSTLYTREIFSYSDGAHLKRPYRDNVTLPWSFAKGLTTAYLSAVTFVDHLIGLIVAELKELDLDSSTIVTLMGDHGFHLGENAIWGKHTNFERGVHAPLMIHVPGSTDNGLQSSSLVEFVDLFPTLVELAGLPSLPTCPPVSAKVVLCTEGQSFKRLIKNPDKPFKSEIYSQHMKMFKYMTYAVKTQQFRYNVAVPINFFNCTNHITEIDIDWNAPIGVELYDQINDPEETVNIAIKPEMEGTCAELQEKLEKHFTRITNSKGKRTCLDGSAVLNA